MFALIQDNKVIQIEENTFPVCGLEWIECNQSVKTGHYYIDGQFKSDIRTLDQKKNDLKMLLIRIRKKYLNDTDYYILRELDEPNSYPIEVKNRRILARQEINAIELSVTLTDLQQFSESFE